jgi:hypothetical protein
VRICHTRFFCFIFANAKALIFKQLLMAAHPQLKLG